MKPFSRRDLIRGAGAAAAAAALAGPGRAFAQTAEKPAVLLIFLRGGYNALFSSADSFVSTNTFNMTGTNTTNLGNGLVVDAATYGTNLPVIARQSMATIGINHGISSHDPAQLADWSDGSRSYALMLANAMGGTAPIKAAVLGATFPPGPRPAEGSVSMQQVSDLTPTINALQGSAPDPNIPTRATAVAALTAARGISAAPLAANPSSLKSVREAYDTGISVLGQQQTTTFSYATVAQAYGVSATATAVSSFKMQMVAAELMTLAGANVLMASSGGWDTHGDTSGNTVRNMMNTNILPGLSTYISRMRAITGRNVVVGIYGDFARSLPGSDHARGVSATVIGKYVKVGTTGRMNVANASSGPSLPTGSPSVPAFWSSLASVARSPVNPFGANPHSGLVL